MLLLRAVRTCMIVLAPFSLRMVPDWAAYLFFIDFSAEGSRYASHFIYMHCNLHTIYAKNELERTADICKLLHIQHLEDCLLCKNIESGRTYWFNVMLY